MEDEQWARLPMGAREWLREQVDGKTINFASTAGGYASGVAGLLTASGKVFFVKAVPLDSPSAADYITEARVARALASSVPTPRLLHEGSAEGWVLLVFEVAKGQTPDEPWPRDHLLTVMKMLDGLSPSQICVLDWGRACIGPDWVDVVCLLLESDAGSTDLESLFLQSARAMDADPQAVEAFLTVLASYWRHAATLTHDVPAELKRRREFSSQSALQWLQQRWHS